MKKNIRKFVSCLFLSTLTTFVSNSYAGDSLIDQMQKQQKTKSPVSLSEVYSDIELQLSVATKADTPPCQPHTCIENQAFDRRVAALTKKLVSNMHEIYAKYDIKLPSITVKVADKMEAGSISSASGEIVLLRGLQQLNLADEALSFVIAREMGHIISNHNRDNSQTKLLISAFVTVIFPAAGILSSSATLFQASAATSMVSMLGSNLAVSSIKPKQLQEADFVALTLLGKEKDNLANLVNGLPLKQANSNGWLNDLQASKVAIRNTLKMQTLVAQK